MERERTLCSQACRILGVVPSTPQRSCHHKLAALHVALPGCDDHQGQHVSVVRKSGKLIFLAPAANRPPLLAKQGRQTHLRQHFLQGCCHAGPLLH